MPTISGESYARRSGKFIYAISYIPGSEPKKAKDNYAALGEITAKLHSLKGYTIHTNFTTPTEVPRMIARARKFSMDPLYEQLVNGLPDFESLPTCLIQSLMKAV